MSQGFISLKSNAENSIDDYFHFEPKSKLLVVSCPPKVFRSLSEKVISRPNSSSWNCKKRLRINSFFTIWRVNFDTNFCVVTEIRSPLRVFSFYASVRCVFNGSFSKAFQCRCVCLNRVNKLYRISSFSLSL